MCYEKTKDFSAEPGCCETEQVMGMVYRCGVCETHQLSPNCRVELKVLRRQMSFDVETTTIQMRSVPCHAGEPAKNCQRHLV